MNPETPDAGLEPSPAADLDGVLGTALAVAQEQLAEHGGLMPFAVVLETDEATARRVAAGEESPEDGEPALRLVVVDPATENEDDEIDGDVVISELVEALRAQRGDLAAAAIVSDVSLTDEDSDAIHVEAEHASRLVAGLLQPYTLGDAAPAWGELMGDDAEGFGLWAD